jgi:hypothetical protein
VEPFMGKKPRDHAAMLSITKDMKREKAADNKK